MEKVPFSQSGIDQKLSELYKLPDDELVAEAGFLQADLRSWLLDVFSFNEFQVEYLTYMNNDWLWDAGQIAGKAVTHRLPVFLHPPFPDPPPGSSKYVRSVDQMVVTHHPGEKNMVTGSVTFIIEYR